MIVLCTICSDLLNPSENLYVTKCGHLFHYQCLHTWIVRAKTCPQCRNRVTDRCMFRFYPTTTDTLASGEENASNLQVKLDHSMLMLNQQSVELKTFQEKIDKANSALEKTENTVKSLEQKIISRDSALAAHREKINYLKSENKKLCDVEKDLKLCQKQMQALQGLQAVFNGTVDEVEMMLEGYPDVRTVATFATALKKALYESESKKSDLRNKLQAARQDLAEEKSKYNNVKHKYDQLLDTYSEVTKNYEGLKNKPKNNEDHSLNESACWSMLKPNQSASSSSLHKTIFRENDKSLNARSPYLTLKHSNIAWECGTSKTTPQKYETAKVTTAHYSNWSDDDDDIFNENKVNGFIEINDDSDQCKPYENISYDGLGGHAPISEVMPKPKSNKPKLTAKHRLKRPNPDGVPKLTEFLKKHRS